MSARDQLEPIEQASRDALVALQLERLKDTVARAYACIPHYKTKFDAAGVHPADLKNLSDLARFPFTTKDDLRQNYPFGMFAVPMADIVRIHASSGTTGKPTVVGYTRNDIETWSSLMARSIRAAGGRSTDKIHVAYGYGLFTGGLGAHYGGEFLGATVIPVGGGFTERQVQLIRDFQPDIIMVTPSYMLAIADEFERQGFSPRDCSLRLGIFGAEPWTESMRTEIERRMGLEALDLYGLSEVIGPGVAQECVETKDGLTIWEDHFFPEIINPETGRVVPDGEPGELVITPLTKEAMPVIRYRTRDLTRLLPGTARAMRRIERIKGRSDDMLIIRGVNVFPSQIEAVLGKEPQLAPHYVLEVRRPHNLDELDVLVEIRPGLSGKMSADEQATLARKAEHLIRGYVGISAAVRVLEPGTIERSQGKAKRVIDRRQAFSVARSNTMTVDAASVTRCLREAGLDSVAVADWLAAAPRETTDFTHDRGRYAEFWRKCDDLVRRLPRKPARSGSQNDAAQRIITAGRDQRERFLAAHAETLYDELTQNRSRFVRLEELVFAAAAAVPGLTPLPAQVAAEAELLQRDKDGIEIDQGIFLAHVLASEPSGRHLCHAMLLPRPEAAEFLQKLDGECGLDLGKVRIERCGNAIFVTSDNRRFLNAEDNTTIDAMEIAIDVAILDPATDVAVLRGANVDHPKYRGRRLFGAGINLTHLYRGQIPFLWFLKRDLGFVHKFFRGVARPEAIPDDVHGTGIEKPWIAALDGFAIGGHCQILLAVDYVLAAKDAFISLPARKEGIIPGAANLRMPRFTGDRIARQAIQYERKIACDSPEGRLICDEIAEPDDMDRALERVVAGLTSSGAVSATSNRRALRIGEEPLDLFRRYFSAYARDQAYCHFSPALIANLEREWNAHNRKL